LIAGDLVRNIKQMQDIKELISIYAIVDAGQSRGLSQLRLDLGHGADSEVS
jgi:hypothetical protein